MTLLNAAPRAHRPWLPGFITRPTVLAGFTNIWRKETAEWFHTRRFALATGLTTLMLGLVPIVYWLYEGGIGNGQVTGGYETLMVTWVALSLTLGSYLVAALTMGILLREEDTGTAQWLFTKPVSRVAYVLAKYLSTVTVVVVGAVLVPSLVFFALVNFIHAGGVPDWGATFTGISIVALNAAVVVGMVVGLSALLKSAAAVAGVTIALNFIPIFLKSMVDDRITGFFPITMGEVAMHAVQQTDLRPWQPVISGVVIAVVGVAFACYRLSRRQLQ